MGSVEVTALAYARPGAAELFADVGFRVGNGEHVALVGANGTGKTTLLRVIAGDLGATRGTVYVDGRLLFMRQLMGTPADDQTVRDLLISLSPAAVRRAAAELDAAELVAAVDPSEPAGLRLARAHALWDDAGGWELEVQFDVCTVVAMESPYERVATRPLSTLSGGEQKRLALEFLLRSDADVLLLDEPDNFLDVPAKEWLEQSLVSCQKTILFVSHDRELLARVAAKIVTIEGRGAWTHGGSFAAYHDARDARLDRIDEEHRRFDEERKKLQAELVEYRRRAQVSDVFASRVRAAKTKIARHERETPRERPAEQRIDMRLAGDRTAKRALICEKLELSGLTEPFDLEVFYGERVGVVGYNGTGKSHFLRLLAGESVEHSGQWRLGARVVPGYFSQMHDLPELDDRPLLDVVIGRGLARGQAMAMLRRYELHEAWPRPFGTLSGGQQARFQVMLLELAGATMLLLDEPTDNLDLASADALEAAIAQFRGTVLVVTHDRWLMRSCDRFVIFGRDCTVTESLDPVYR